MQHSTNPPTKAQQKRFERMSQIGCIVSILRDGRHNVLGHVHHILSGGKRIGHDATLYLSVWHHVGQPPNGWTIQQATEELGPSLAHNPRAFREEFGSEAELLEFQNALLDHYIECERSDEE